MALLFAFIELQSNLEWPIGILAVALISAAILFVSFNFVSVTT